MKVLVVLALAFAIASAAILPSKIRFTDIQLPASATVPEGRITNGQTAKPAQIPYQVSLLINGGGVCGGSLISETFVLTAAHCVDSAMIVQLGFGSIERKNPLVPRTAMKSAITIHPEWNPQTLVNDVALIKVDAVSFSSNIRPVSLPKSDSYQTYEGQNALASGWGKTTDDSGVAPLLQYANLPVISNTDCAKTFGSYVTDGNICTSTWGSVSTCNGDSGGPLVTDDGKTQVGIVSYGAAAGCTLNHPVVFTRVTKFLPWISKISGVAYN